MIPLLAQFFRELLFDKAKARRWTRGIFLWMGGAGIMVASVGWDVAKGWTLREWAGRLAIAGILGLGGLVSVGEKNEKPGRIAGKEP